MLTLSRERTAAGGEGPSAVDRRDRFKANCATATATGWKTSSGALGPILNTITLWNTIYLDHAIGQLHTTGYPVLDADVARLSPYMRRHMSFHGHYSFAPTNLAG